MERGKGQPRKAVHMGRGRAFADGGGLVSPGRWAPGKRTLPGGIADTLREELKDCFDKAVAAKKFDAAPFR